MHRKKCLVWIDLEMTGLEVERDLVLEFAMIITDKQLNVIYSGPNYVIHYDQLPTMDPWVVDVHTKSGLLQEVANSATSLLQVQETALSILKEFCDPKKGVLCGNSVWQDGNFMRKHMPDIMHYLDYRIIDVSSVKELVRKWYPKDPHVEFKKQDKHRALIDIQESIDELRHYRHYFFKDS